MDTASWSSGLSEQATLEELIDAGGKTLFMVPPNRLVDHKKNTKDALTSYKTVHDLFEIKQCEKLVEDATTVMDKCGAWNGESLLLTLFQSTAFTPVERKKKAAGIKKPMTATQWKMIDSRISRRADEVARLK